MRFGIGSRTDDNHGGTETPAVSLSAAATLSPTQRPHRHPFFRNIRRVNHEVGDESDKGLLGMPRHGHLGDDNHRLSKIDPLLVEIDVSDDESSEELNLELAMAGLLTKEMTAEPNVESEEEHEDEIEETEAMTLSFASGLALSCSDSPDGSENNNTDHDSAANRGNCSRQPLRPPPRQHLPWRID